MYEFSELLVMLMASGIGLALAFGLYLVNALTYYKMAQKAGVRNAWMAFVPFLQFVLFFHIINRSAWLIFAFLVPLLNIILYFYWHYQLFEAFGVGGGMGALILVLSVFTGIALPIYLFYIAFSSNVSYVSEHRYGAY